jgi:hypothetical protein
MGGLGSGRWGGRPTANAAKKIDLAWMIRTGRAKPGQWASGSLSWNYGGSPAGSIGYVANMEDAGDPYLRLMYWRGEGADRQHVEQVVRLVFTQPHFGGRKWWMICPYSGRRVAKLYLPSGGDRFASRHAWKLGYQSQRVGRRDRPFEKLFRLQRKLGSEQGWEAPLRRPKGMWRRTYERHLERYYELDDECAAEMAMFVLRWRPKG